MQRLRDNAMWTLFNSVDVPGLSDLYGDSFTEAYETYERVEGLGRPVAASELFSHICAAQRETGGPFIMYLDAINCESGRIFLFVLGA